MKNAVETIGRYLFEEDDADVFCVLDGATVTGLLGHLYNCDLEYECLYRGELQPDLAEVAPYLVRLQENSDVTRWVIEKGWGRHWGVFARSREGLRSLRGHFRRFLTVHDGNGKPLYFRYYDPRVLRVYLPTCNAQELTDFFGPVDRYLLEDAEGKAILGFANHSGLLHRTSDELKED